MNLGIFLTSWGFENILGLYENLAAMVARWENKESVFAVKREQREALQKNEKKNFNRKILEAFIEEEKYLDLKIK